MLHNHIDILIILMCARTTEALEEAEAESKLELLSVRVEFAGSKIAITTANFGGLKKNVYPIAALKLGFMMICAIQVPTPFLSKVSCMSHKQSMDMLLTAWNASRAISHTRALNYALTW